MRHEEEKEQENDNECEIWGCISFRIEDVDSGIPKDLHSAFLASAIGGGKDPELDLLDIEVNRQRENIKFLWRDIKESCISLLDNHYSTGDPEFLVAVFDSLLESRADGDWVFYATLTFLRDFLRILIRSGTMMGVNRMHLTDRLIQVEMVAVKLARLICISWFQRDNYDKEEGSKMIMKDLIGAMFIGADPQVRQTLKASVPTNFIHSLIYKLMNLLRYETCSAMPSVKFQMQKLPQGLPFRQILFKEQHNKFDGLGDEMKDLILGAVIDAGIVIFSLSVNEPKEGLSKETDLAFLHLLEVLKLIMAEVEQHYPPASLSFTFPTNELDSFDFLLENLKELASCEADSIAFLKDQIHIVQEVLLRSFLGNILEPRNQNKKLQAFWNRVIEVGCKAEFVIDSIVVGVKSDCSLMPLASVSEEIQFLKAKAPEIYGSVRLDIQAQTVAKSSTHMPSHVSAPKLNEILVGHDEEVKMVIDELTRSSQQLDLVSIVGMPGIGKTTLVNKIFLRLTATSIFVSIFVHGVLFLKYITSTIYYSRF